MNHNAGAVPFQYGDLLAITDGPTFWFQDKSGVIRGVKLQRVDGSYKLSVGEDEIIVKRAGADTGTRAFIRPSAPKPS
ncbi:MAG: hypothetical protein HYY16_01615 [Planctomycetes bacterium]|nr:hypothetical protein [Planctomycetota bacterium]